MILGSSLGSSDEVDNRDGTKQIAMVEIQFDGDSWPKFLCSEQAGGDNFSGTEVKAPNGIPLRVGDQVITSILTQEDGQSYILLEVVQLAPPKIEDGEQGVTQDSKTTRFLIEPDGKLNKLSLGEGRVISIRADWFDPSPNE